MCVLRTSWNVLNFSMANVIFSFVVGILVLTFGFYGRVSERRPVGGPYYRAERELGPETGEGVDAGVGRGDDTPGRRADDPDPRV